MELSNNSLYLLENLKSKFQGRPVSVSEIQSLNNYTEISMNELKEHDIINEIIKDDYTIIWLTTKGAEINVSHILEKREEEKEKEKLDAEIKELKTKIAELDQADKNYEQYEPEYEEYINLLHEYNEIKDVGQILMGRLAELEGTTTKSVYSEYNMNLED